MAVIGVTNGSTGTNQTSPLPMAIGTTVGLTPTTIPYHCTDHWDIHNGPHRNRFTAVHQLLDRSVLVVPSVKWSWA